MVRNARLCWRGDLAVFGLPKGSKYAQHVASVQRAMSGQCVPNQLH